jgi:hypothetical protein
MMQEKTGVKRSVATVGAILLGLIYLVSGAWKVLQPFKAGELLEQSRVPAGWGPVGAASLGAIELFIAFLLFVPAFRRLGGVLGSALMVFFLGWIAYFYPQLVGQECNCFPIIKRTVGPMFFVGDGIFLLFGLAAWLWSKRTHTVRGASIALAVVVCLAAVSFAADRHARGHLQVPAPITADGKQVSLAEGKIFLYFYDPQCAHCFAAAKTMSTLHWGSTKVIGLPTASPEFAAQFLLATGMKAETSLDTARLRKTFQFVDPPFGAALEEGQVKGTLGTAQFEAPQPGPELKKLGFAE